MLYLGVDLGTSSVKVLLVDETGAVRKTASRTYPLEFPQPGWSQQNPADWWNAVVQCVPELLEGEDKAQVAGLSVGGQMHGLVVLDENDQVIRPAILWNDGRTGRETEELNADFGKEKLLSLVGNIAFAGFTAPKLLWMRRNEPELFQKIKKIMLPKDYLVYRLTGVHSCDYSDASGMLLLDVANRRWSPELLSYCSVTEEQMPKLFESYESVGTVLPEIAAQLGLPEGVVVAAGAGDNAAAAVGTGTVGNGCCNVSLGTSGTVFISSDDFRLPPEGNLHAFAHADGAYHLMGCILSAASAYGWWTKEILKATSDNDEQNPITDEDLGRNPVFFLPYLMGERSPHNDPAARGAFLGMSMDTTRYQMTQAILEGVAFAIRDSVEIARSLGIEITESGLCGGGAKSPLWRKIMANVLNMEMQVPVQEEGAGYGGAILAMVAAGAYGSVREACEKLRTERRIYKPDPAIAARYEKRYQVFKSLYPTLKAAYPTLAVKE
ncbi:MAG TPA: xylulokinase [Candidatus Avoscillospira avicola]|uniref:Xylulose kinase n=1 Tax=Candidatus Avoscillospira avicola TaxID=2840706 RepID=A0A9D1DH43_9FIRM|nr:xylulokinase [Candidatus Avoscillospira avicola]